MARCVLGLRHRARVECTQMCGWNAGYSSMTRDALRHFYDTGHETAVIYSESVHYHRMAPDTEETLWLAAARAETPGLDVERLARALVRWAGKYPDMLDAPVAARAIAREYAALEGEQP